ncbi:MAG TPA: prenyltransferase/squalene oxidase repeat-containing protein [Thermoanaerobaculia bacterium]|nr:prenyltransferase/squalene oxidase repeat-containing protein [Thermoanaerobaculia bacterium]
MITLPWSLVQSRFVPSGMFHSGILALVTIGFGLCGAVPGKAQPVASGVAYLSGGQEADGSWQSTEVRRVLATTEALRALQAVGQTPAVRSAAASFLAAEPIEDTDDRARRIVVLAAEGSGVSSLVSQLLADADSQGGWGLTASFVSDPLDTALALTALASQATVGNDVLIPAFSSLIAAQKADGGWPCIDAGEDSEIFCTGEALLTLAAYRSRFLLAPQIDAAAGFLRGQRNSDGSFGPAGPSQVIHTAMAALALAAVPAFGNEVATVSSFLAGRQQADGSWEGDPYTTALALRALHALSLVPYCGDGAINQPGEACDGGVPAGLTCQGLGLGPGNLTCSPQCTLNTSGCSAAPVCGDNLRNQPFEVCDGTDLAAQTCQSQGFPAGTLACATDCLSFNVGGCIEAPTCGDGVVNQPGELCDLSDLHGATCESLGLGGGLLRCASDCNLDTSQCDAASFVIDNKGREFIVGLMPNPLGAVTASVQLTSDVPTSVTIQYPVNSPTFSQTVPVTPGQVRVVNLPAGTHTNWSAGQVLNNAIRVSGPDDFVLYLVNRAPFTSDAGMALPVDALGTSYIVTTYRGSLAHSGDRSQFLVIAPFDGTHVTITPAQTLRFPPGTNAPPNVPFQITLNRGQGFRGEAVFSNGDLTGTLIESDRPIAVLNGNLCANIPATTTACDHIFEVAHPVRAWGTSALVANLPNRPGGSIYRILSSVDGTQVTRDGVLQATLDRGRFLEVGPLAGNHVFAADHPIFVSQFMTGVSSPGAILGDPAMVNVIPPDQYLKSYTFSTVGGSQFVNHFLTVITPTAAISGLTLDGNPIPAGQFSPIGGTDYSSAVVPLPEGSHTTSSPEAHGITVEGLNSADSYLYPGGARLEFINLFCGDGSANRNPEECDGSDFRGASCSSFGFSAGFLQCTLDCRVDTSQCSGFTSEDRDGDGYPATEDCNDQDPQVNPGMQEILGNGVDDDCNRATPDTIPQAAVSCRLLSDRLSYMATEIALLEGTVENAHDSFSLTGLSAVLKIRNGSNVFDETRQLAPLPPDGRAQQNFVFAAAGHAPGSYQAELTVSAAGSQLAQCSAGFTIESSASTGAGLGGDLTLNPELVNAGDPSDASYIVRNQGNATLTDLAIRVLLVDPETGAILGELNDTATLASGASFSATRPFSTAGLATNKSYLVVLLAKPEGTDVETTLDNAVLTVVNAPPDCTGAVAIPVHVSPPNHKLVQVKIGGVTDPDGDPVTVTVIGVLQDERTDDLGSGDTCPDAFGVGTPKASVRAERSGRQDGRVYHVFFKASDGRGGECEREVRVCVPHDNRPDATCVDQGALFDSTVCP